MKSKIVPLLLTLVLVVVTVVVLDSLLFPVSRTATSRWLIQPSLPEGDPEAGRIAFVELQCNGCHRVQNDPTLPAASWKGQGPMLCAMNQWEPDSIATAITARSHQRPDQFLEGQASGMGFFADRMTVRQLVDIVAYLQSFPSSGNQDMAGSGEVSARPFE